MMKENEYTSSELVGKQVTSLLDQTGISIAGLAIGTEISLNHLRTIKNGTASISSKTAGKIAIFFGVSIDVIFSTELHKLEEPKNQGDIGKFYKENANNREFFVDRQQENSVAYSINTNLIPSQFFAEGREVSYVQKYLREEHGLDFSSKDISQHLTRLSKKGILTKEDKTGNKSIYLYKLKSKKNS